MGEQSKNPPEQNNEETNVENSNEENKEENKNTQSPKGVIVLRVYMHCQGWTNRVVKCLRGFYGSGSGVEEIEIDAKNHKVTVMGKKADPTKVAEMSRKKTHKHDLPLRFLMGKKEEGSDKGRGLLPITVPVPVSVYGDPSNVKFFYLVLQWPNAFCDVDCCCNPVNQNFTIHGFWPQVANGNSTYCEATPLQKKDVRHIKKQLSRDWPNLTCSRCNFNFWQKQWKKHGSCSKLDPRSYFNTTIKLKEENVPDLLSILQQFEIVPDKRKTYQVQLIQKAIVKKTHWKPLTKCINYSNNGDVQIHEIRFCVKPPRTPEVQEFEFINCTRWPYMGCGDHENSSVFFSPEKKNLTATGKIFNWVEKKFFNGLKFISSSLTLPRRQTQSEEEAEDEL